MRCLPFAIVFAAFSSLAAEKEAKPVTDWAVSKVTLTSGKQVVVNYRVAEPAKVNRAAFSWRTIVHCPFADRGDGQGLPSAEALRPLQVLEAKLTTPGTIRLMSKTGEGARDTVFQVKDRKAFEALVVEQTKALQLECTATTNQDIKWSMWETAAKQFAAAPVAPAAP